MPAVDLAREHLSAIDNMVAARGLPKLVKMGVGGPAYVAAGLVGLARVELAGETYQPTPGGELVYVQPVVEDDELIDLCGWLADHPDRWALRLGVGFALGEDAIRAAMWPSAGPLPLHRTPLDWLRADCTGACILRPADAWRELADFEAVVAENIDHGRAVEKMLTPPRWPRPKVLVRQAEGIAA